MNQIKSIRSNREIDTSSLIKCIRFYFLIGVLSIFKHHYHRHRHRYHHWRYQMQQQQQQPCWRRQLYSLLSRDYHVTRRLFLRHYVEDATQSLQLLARRRLRRVSTIADRFNCRTFVTRDDVQYVVTCSNNQFCMQKYMYLVSWKGKFWV